MITLWTIIPATYLALGLTFVFVGPAARLRRQEKETVEREAADVPPWKQSALLAGIAFGIILLWPVLVVSAARTIKNSVSVWDALQLVPEFQRRKQLFDAIAPLCENGIETDVFPNGVGEFGLVPTNPIPCRTVFGSKYYLDRVRTVEGEKVCYERIGSLISTVTSGPVDAYSIKTQSGNCLTTVYVSPYQKRNSSKPPTGFILVDIPPGTIPVCHSRRVSPKYPGANIFLKGPALVSDQTDRTTEPTNMAQTSDPVAAYTAAVGLLDESAKSGHAPAQFILGLIYIHGEGEAQRIFQGETLISNAAKQGYSPAQFILGLIHWQGLFVERGLHQAAYWLRRSAEQGYREARKLRLRVEHAAASEKWHARQNIKRASTNEGHRIDTDLSRDPMARTCAPSFCTPYDYRNYFPDAHRDGDKGRVFGPKYAWIMYDVAYSELPIDTNKHKRTSPTAYSVIGSPRGEAYREVYSLGLKTGQACRKRVMSRWGGLSDSEQIRLAESIANGDGLTQPASDRGMEKIVDGADPLFDEKRAAFINGVLAGICEP